MTEIKNNIQGLMGDEFSKEIVKKFFNIDIPSNMETYETGTGQIVHVHPRADCEARGGHCCIHNPSDHHMVDWPTHWRDDRGLMERICEHGVGHPDPDDIAFKEAMEPDFKTYQQQVKVNASAMATTLASRGYNIVSGGTASTSMIFQPSSFVSATCFQGSGPGLAPMVKNFRFLFCFLPWTYYYYYYYYY